MRPWIGVKSHIEFEVNSWPGRLSVMPLAVGSRPSIFWPSELIRSAGMTLPGNGCPVRGSMIGWIVPLVTRVCEKSPRFSASVGMFARLTVDGRLSSVYSCEPKKHIFLPELLPRLSMRPGMTIGPPMP